MTLIPTPHIAAVKEDLGKVVLMPGDPYRSRFMAENYLEDPRLINDIRGMLGYTGYYHGKKLSIMTSGIGIPSISIYAYELFNFYDIDTIIRVGSIGSIQPCVNVSDIILADLALTDSSFMKNFKVPEGYVSKGSDALTDMALKIAQENGLEILDHRDGLLDLTDGNDTGTELIMQGAEADAKKHMPEDTKIPNEKVLSEGSVGSEYADGTENFSDIRPVKNEKEFSEGKSVHDISDLGRTQDLAQSRQAVKLHIGKVLTEEIYYSQADGDMVQDYRDLEVLGFEMEAAALFANAAQAGKQAMSIFTVSNDILTGGEMPPEDRVTSFGKMFEIAFGVAGQLA